MRKSWFCFIFVCIFLAVGVAIGYSETVTVYNFSQIECFKNGALVRCPENVSIDEIIKALEISVKLIGNPYKNKIALMLFDAGLGNKTISTNEIREKVDESARDYQELNNIIEILNKLKQIQKGD